MSDLDPGILFAGDFRVVRPIGRGGMGAVYLAEQLSTGKSRALKVMNASLLDRDKRASERFLQEARVGSRIQSEHVVDVIAAGIEGDPTGMPTPWLAMELLEGRSLDEEVKANGPLAADRALTVFGQLCHGLGAAHRAGLVHRDVKPENIFLAESKSATQSLKVKLLDFGIAKVLQKTVSQAGGTTAAVGTPLFMAPEQMRPGDVDPRADVWALGLVAYFALTGELYWASAHKEGVPLTALLLELAGSEIEAPSVRAASQGRTVPDGFDAWFLGCVHRDLEKRFPDADAAWRAFSGRLSGTGLAQTLAADTLEDVDDMAATGHYDGDAGLASAISTTETVPAPSSGYPTPVTVFAAVGVLVVIGLITFVSTFAWSGGGGVDDAQLRSTMPETVPTASDRPTGETGAEEAESEETGSEQTGSEVPEAVTPEEARPLDAVEPTPVPTSSGDGPGVAPVEPAPAERRRRPTLSRADREVRDRFVEAAPRFCQGYFAQYGRQPVRVQIRQWLRGDGGRVRWDVRPREASPCLAAGPASIRWPGTGRDRVVEFSFTMRPLPIR